MKYKAHHRLLSSSLSSPVHQRHQQLQSTSINSTTYQLPKHTEHPSSLKMHFTTITTLATFALALPAMAAPSANPVAAPAPVEVMDITSRGTINEAEVFALAPLASCSILSCVSVISQAVCISDAIEADDYKEILKCAKKKELCGCAGCFKKLNGFLEKWGIC